ncbi:hypothetical protein HNR25_003736 [Streptomonospora salina]|uniref:Uncharacterized protein n=1 Tax=Streptomonospora salina TaxID=104205 RepID=A0A841EA35_9ACTN|nr:hypothetical protein [Streptomonospora salina]
MSDAVPLTLLLAKMDTFPVALPKLLRAADRARVPGTWNA